MITISVVDKRDGSLVLMQLEVDDDGSIVEAVIPLRRGQQYLGIGYEAWDIHAGSLVELLADDIGDVVLEILPQA